MKRPCLAFLTIALLTLTSAVAEFRQWTATDGRSLRAEFVSVDGDKVTIRRYTDGRKFTMELAKLSEADQKWVKDQATTLADAEVAANAEADDANPYTKLITGKWERHEDKGLHYRLFAERRLRQQSGLTDAKTYPLVICLHGKNGDVMTPENPSPAHAFAKDNTYRERRCFILAPQAPKDNETWSGANAEAVVKIAKDMIKHLPIDPKRIYLTGYSMGAFGTFHLLGREPKFFAAAVPVAGGGSPSQAKSFRKVPIWVFHGAQDPTVNVEQSRTMVEALKKARSEVKYTEYPDGDHGIGGKVYADEEVHVWMFAQAKK